MNRNKNISSSYLLALYIHVLVLRQREDKYIGCSRDGVIFTRAALLALFIGLVAGKVLAATSIASAEQHWHIISALPNIVSPFHRQGWAGSWEGAQLGQMTQTD